MNISQAPVDAPTSPFQQLRPNIDMMDALDNPFFGNPGQDFMNSKYTMGMHGSFETALNQPPIQQPVQPDPLAQQSKLVAKMDALPSSLATNFAVIFWDAVLDHFQYYDEFFTSLHTIATPWLKIPFQGSWLIYDATWQTSIETDKSCLGM